MRHRNVRLMLALPLAAACALTVGCSRVDGYRLNPTPEVMTLGNTPDEVANKTTTTFDTNFRNLNEAAARAVLVDKPLRLTPKAVPW